LNATDKVHSSGILLYINPLQQCPNVVPWDPAKQGELRKSRPVKTERKAKMHQEVKQSK